MSTRIVVTDKAGLTLADLARLVNQARAAGATGTEAVTGAIRMNNRVKQLVVDVDPPEAPGATTAMAWGQETPAAPQAAVPPAEPKKRFWGDGVDDTPPTVPGPASRLNAPDVGWAPGSSYTTVNRGDIEPFPAWDIAAGKPDNPRLN